MKISLISAALVLVSSAALAEVDASNPARLLDLLRSEGFAVDLGADGVGDPKITGKHNGTQFQVFFYDCSENVDCRTLQFQVGYNLTDGMDFAQANKWNAEMRYGAVYLDDEMDPYLQMDVNIDHGVSEDNFVDNYKMWTKVMGEFEEFIDW
ncbi:YbjN domain-containing protein [Tropicibacter oceani]|uniref:YbjN domain-containing protein n=1 Tax=Tropicibacter oceani TaxID=3058420 RepID=A0ABY8QL84_9RHOB|nr:YbjN domain-containing protein [Tropicibacter oceani]WGW05390.1 YbjN domain-containing protein [Tropicibacter oceani]